jgi:predicted nucleotidyltransferase
VQQVLSNASRAAAISFSAEFVLGPVDGDSADETLSTRDDEPVHPAILVAAAPRGLQAVPRPSTMVEPMSIFEPVIDALARAGVRYVIVGGVAVVLHGYARLTADLDVAVDLAPAEAAKAIRALTEAGLRPVATVDPQDFADPDIRARWVEERNMKVFSLRDAGNPMVVVDLFVTNPIEFATLWERSEEAELYGHEVRIASVPDLIAMKRLAGRPQDESDIDALEEILRRNGAP